MATSPENLAIEALAGILRNSATARRAHPHAAGSSLLGDTGSPESTSQPPSAGLDSPRGARQYGPNWSLFSMQRENSRGEGI